MRVPAARVQVSRYPGGAGPPAYGPVMGFLPLRLLHQFLDRIRDVRLGEFRLFLQIVDEGDDIGQFLASVRLPAEAFIV